MASLPQTTEKEQPDSQEETWLSRLHSGAWWFVQDQWFVIVLAFLILIASQVQAPNQELKKTLVEYITVAVIFLVNGCTVPTSVLAQNLWRLHLHVFIQSLCFLITSASALAVVQAAATKSESIDAALLNGFVLLGCLPTALSFNTIMTKKANGNEALTLTESVIGSLIAPAISTVLISTYSSVETWYTAVLPKASTSQYGLVFQHVFKQFGLTLFLPLVVGQFLQNLFPAHNKKVMHEWQGKKLASFALLVLIWSAFDGAFATGSFSTLSSTDVAFLVLVSIGLFAFWLVVSLLVSAPWLSREDTIAVAYCVPTKTPALGVPLVSILFAGAGDLTMTKLYVPMVVFQCIQTGLSSLATIPLKRWQERAAVAQQKLQVGEGAAESSAEFGGIMASDHMELES